MELFNRIVLMHLPTFAFTDKSIAVRSTKACPDALFIRYLSMQGAMKVLIYRIVVY